MSQRSTPDSPTITVADPGQASTPAPLSRRQLPRLHVEAAGSPDSPDSDLVVLGLLGQGGMGLVERGQQRSLGREVALKRLRPDRDDTGALLHEARITGSLEHPNIIPVHALGLDEQGRPLLVMKRIDGVSLGQLLRSPGHEGWTWLQRAHGTTTRIESIVAALIPVATALEFAHSRDVVHRDVKPDNILLGRFGEVYLADWGIALRLDEPSSQPRVAGTPAYMAPEMTHDGGPLDPACDVFLLGATLHEALTGRRRHEGADRAALLAAAARSEPFDYPPDVPVDLARLCRDATARPPAARPSITAMRQRLLDHRRHAAATRLTDEALTQLDALVERISTPDFDPEAMHRGLLECRFGLTAARREYPDSPETAAGFALYLRVAAAFELAQGNLQAARSRLDEMLTPDPVLLARLHELGEEQAREAAQNLARAEVARQHDAGVDARGRIAFLGALFVVLVLVAGSLLLPRALRQELTVGDLARANVIVLGAVLGLVVTERRRLLTTTVNRRFIALLLLSITALLVHRVLAWHRGDDLAATMADDLVLFGAILASGVAPLGRWLPLVALVSLAGAVLIALHLASPVLVFALCIALSLALLLAASRRQRRGDDDP